MDAKPTGKRFLEHDALPDVITSFPASDDHPAYFEYTMTCGRCGEEGTGRAESRMTAAYAATVRLSRKACAPVYVAASGELVPGPTVAPVEVADLVAA